MGSLFLYGIRSNADPLAKDVVATVSDAVFPAYHRPLQQGGLILADRHVEERREMLAIVGADLLQYLGEKGLINLQELNATLQAAPKSENIEGEL